MKAVWGHHGALLIFDEVMCGMGRTGTLHAWEHDGIVPDIQAIGKCLGSGYVPISAVLATERVIAAFQTGSKYFVHGQTYQFHPLACAAALEVQHIMQDESLVRDRLGDHPNVGDIRGRGLLWAIEFVANRTTKVPLDPALKVANQLHDKGMTKGYDVSIFQATGSANDEQAGDYILLATPYVVQKSDAEEIAGRVQ
jgi:adenosylmethionine-8-amino-7-oxononanoate aminotransferase